MVIAYTQLFGACQRFSELIINISAALHAVPNEKRCIQQFHAVLFFSRNLYHQRIQITAIDFFVVDNRLLNSARSDKLRFHKDRSLIYFSLLDDLLDHNVHNHISSVPAKRR